MEVVVVSAKRTPIGRFLGALSSLTAQQLGAIAIEAVIKEAKIKKSLVDQVIMGNCIQAGLGQNPARQAALLANFPASTPAFTINHVCGSGMQAIIVAVDKIRSGNADIIIVGGFESMSNAPHAVYLRDKVKYGDTDFKQVCTSPPKRKLIDTLISDGLWDCFYDKLMGDLTQNICNKFKVTRKQMDEFSLESHKKAIKAQQRSYFKNEIVPVKIKNKIIKKDEGPRPDTSLEKLAALKPVFKGTQITAGNSSGLNDAGAALLLMSAKKAKQLKLKPIAKIGASTEVALDPAFFGMAPGIAIEKLEKKTKRKFKDYDLVEINEAFAAQMVGLQKERKYDYSKVNVHGGAIALGHPIGATGARIVITLIHALHAYKKKTGLATICIGGGQGLALEVTR